MALDTETPYKTLRGVQEADDFAANNEDMVRKIVNLSGGLAEVNDQHVREMDMDKSLDSTVQFIINLSMTTFQNTDFEV